MEESIKLEIKIIMEVKTKFNTGDIVYGFYNGSIHSFEIDGIHINANIYKNESYNKYKVGYDVILLDSESSLRDTIDEEYLHDYNGMIRQFSMFIRNESDNKKNEVSDDIDIVKDKFILCEK